MNDILVFDIACRGVKSVVSAAAVYPKPGLITPLNALDGPSGSIDFHDKIECAMALFPCFINCASIGSDTEALPPSDVIRLLEPVGLYGQREVEAIAPDKNILKFQGVIFLIGLLCAAAGRLSAQGRNLTPKALALTAASFTRSEFYSSLMPFSGFDRASSDGCFSETERGFPLTLSIVELIHKLSGTSLTERTAPVSLRECAVHALLRILTENLDAELVGTNNSEYLALVRSRAQHAISSGSVFTQEGLEAIAAMDRELQSQKIIPTGSEAILTAALFVLDLEKLRPPC